MEKEILEKIKPGVTIRVHEKFKEGEKTRTSLFEGTVLARKHGSEIGATFTVRRVSQGVGMEKIFPIHSPNIDKIEILRSPKVRRAKLYYLRRESEKEVRKNLRKEMAKVVAAKKTELAEEPVEVHTVENPVK